MEQAWIDRRRLEREDYDEREFTADDLLTLEENEAYFRELDEQDRLEQDRQERFEDAEPIERDLSEPPF